MQTLAALAGFSLLLQPPLAPCSIDSGLTLAQARAGLCGFDATRQRFSGTPSEQARCLLRPVMRNAQIGQVTLAPASLTGLAGTAVPFSLAQVRRYLAAKGISEADVGGALRANLGAVYFVIHDTSTPNCSEAGACPVQGQFPPDMNEASWRHNKSFNNYLKLENGQWVPTGRKIAHAIINRTGASITQVDFADHISHIKFDYCHDGATKRGLFIGVENIQPRIGDPAIPRPGQRPRDQVGPVPGFTGSEYDRLALLYAVASARKGSWLIPAFHAVIDAYYIDGHDDPQNFDLIAFAASVERVSAALVAQQ